MIPHKKRFSTKLFIGFLKKGRVFSSPTISLRIFLSEDFGRYAVVVSKKVAKTAVGRNKLRRQGYYLFNKHIIKNLPHFSIILFIKKKLLFRDLEAEFLSLFSKININK